MVVVCNFLYSLLLCLTTSLYYCVLLLGGGKERLRRRRSLLSFVIFLSIGIPPSAKRMHGYGVSCDIGLT